MISAFGTGRRGYTLAVLRRFTLAAAALSMLAACSSDSPAEPREVVVTSIVEVPGPTVTSIVTETSIVSSPPPDIALSKLSTSV